MERSVRTDLTNNIQQANSPHPSRALFIKCLRNASFESHYTMDIGVPIGPLIYINEWNNTMAGRKKQYGKLFIIIIIFTSKFIILKEKVSLLGEKTDRNPSWLTGP